MARYTERHPPPPLDREFCQCRRSWRRRTDQVDPDRVNIFERWESQAALETFRSSGPDTETRPAMLTVSVQE
jgi:quinol monooxygenase YgiN